VSIAVWLHAAHCPGGQVTSVLRSWADTGPARERVAERALSVGGAAFPEQRGAAWCIVPSQPLDSADGISRRAEHSFSGILSTCGLTGGGMWCQLCAAA
jgi:hypothetical protein